MGVHFGSIMIRSQSAPEPHTGLGLGIDAGGTQTRWALAAPDGVIVAEGIVAGLSALQMGTSDGRDAVRATFSELAADVLSNGATAGAPARAWAGLTGFGGDSELLQRWLAELLYIAPQQIHFCSDMEIAYRASFKPGEGYLVYAGTGSIGAFIDDAGQFHRAGGRGVVLDDGGGGFWIAREALRHIWRNEDERPGCWRDSPMAHAVFDYVGGSDWADSRQFIYGQERGAVGKLALAVAASAARDPAAEAILRAAGKELARLAQALINRFGPRPVALSGRAAELHPIIPETLRAALPPGTAFTQAPGGAHYAAARMAAAPDPHLPTRP
jgi:N-acetylglucosamine kinase-like BadF-type ATPase